MLTSKVMRKRRCCEEGGWRRWRLLVVVKAVDGGDGVLMSWMVRSRGLKMRRRLLLLWRRSLYLGRACLVGVGVDVDVVRLSRWRGLGDERRRGKRRGNMDVVKAS
jgi:hypothetical protein